MDLLKILSIRCRLYRLNYRNENAPVEGAGKTALHPHKKIYFVDLTSNGLLMQSNLMVSRYTALMLFFAVVIKLPVAIRRYWDLCDWEHWGPDAAIAAYIELLSDSSSKDYAQSWRRMNGSSGRMHSNTGFIAHARNIGLIMPAEDKAGDVYLGMSRSAYLFCADKSIPKKIMHETFRLFHSVELRWPADSSTQSIKKFGEAVAGITARARAYKVEGFGWGSRQGVQPKASERGYNTLYYTRVFLSAFETCYCECFDDVLLSDLLHFVPDQSGHCQVLKEKRGKELRTVFAPLQVSVLSCWACIFERDMQVKEMLSRKALSLEYAWNNLNKLHKRERLDGLDSPFMPDIGEVFFPAQA